jgi:hypothetical protein
LGWSKDDQAKIKMLWIARKQEDWFSLNKESKKGQKSKVWSCEVKMMLEAWESCVNHVR